MRGVFQHPASAQGRPVDVAYSGTVDGNTMKGRVYLAFGQLTGSFTAKKQ